MTNFGFQPCILDYWMLLTDWRNGSFAILLALGILLVGHALALRNKTLAEALSPAKESAGFRARAAASLAWAATRALRSGDDEDGDVYGL
jgi:hypothetical protein